jgi:hypothetical protein
MATTTDILITDPAHPYCGEVASDHAQPGSSAAYAWFRFDGRYESLAPEQFVRLSAEAPAWRVRARRRGSLA